MRQSFLKKRYVKIALVFSVCAILLWAVLGTGASLAWFTDTDEDLNNIFHFGEFDLVVSHRLEDGTYEEIQQDTLVFDDEALYEPGYVQVVYLKVENRGTVPFDYRTAVSVTDYTTGINVFGQEFSLQDYLKFGVVTAATEAELESKLANRDLAKQESVLDFELDMPLNHYSTDSYPLEAGKDNYVALIVRMPEAVDNIANYRGTAQPEVRLGVIVSATQQQR